MGEAVFTSKERSGERLNKLNPPIPAPQSKLWSTTQLLARLKLVRQSLYDRLRLKLVGVIFLLDGKFSSSDSVAPFSIL